MLCLSCFYHLWCFLYPHIPRISQAPCHFHPPPRRAPPQRTVRRWSARCPRGKRPGAALRLGMSSYKCWITYDYPWLSPNIYIYINIYHVSICKYPIIFSIRKTIYPFCNFLIGESSKWDKYGLRFGDVRCLMWLMYVNMGFQWIWFTERKWKWLTEIGRYV